MCYRPHLIFSSTSSIYNRLLIRPPPMYLLQRKESKDERLFARGLWPIKYQILILINMQNYT